MKVIIIGGVAGGATAAGRIKRNDPNAEVLILERSPHISYANCGLPYHISGVIAEKSKMELTTPEKFSQMYNLEVRVNNEAISIDSKNKEITIKNLETNKEYKETYDKLILSPGADAIEIPYKNRENVNNIFPVKNLKNTYDIINFIEKNKVKNAVVVGGGFIGVEVAENLNEMNINTTLITLGSHILQNLDSDYGTIMNKKLEEGGVNVILNNSIDQTFNDKIILKDGKELKADIIIEAVGVRPNISLAQSAGCEIGITKSIVVNTKLETTVKDIYAVGDAIEVNSSVDNSKVNIALAWPANRQGRIVADNITGSNIEYKGSMGASVIKVFDWVGASVGFNGKQLESKNIDYMMTSIKSMSNASYYPTSEDLFTKVYWEKTTGKLLGGQSIGKKNVEKAIDALAVAIKANFTIFDLQDIEHCYAPPFNGAKSPLNLISTVAENDIKLGIKQTALYYQDYPDSIILDVREENEYKCGCSEGSINIPLSNLENQLDKIPKNKELILCCQSGVRSRKAAKILLSNGYDKNKINNIQGGYALYSLGK